jgi:hypothetical protein
VQVRDPYPQIGEKAIGRAGRILSSVSIACTLYGGGCVMIVLIAGQLLKPLDSARQSAKVVPASQAIG